MLTEGVQCIENSSEFSNSKDLLIQDIISFKNAWLFYRKEVVKNYPQLNNIYSMKRIAKKQYSSKYQLILNCKQFHSLKMFEGIQNYLEKLDDQSFKFKFILSCSKIFSKHLFKEIITLILYWYYKYEKDSQILKQNLFNKLIKEGTEQMLWIVNNFYSEWFKNLQIKSRLQTKTFQSQKIAEKYECFIKKLVQMILTVIKQDNTHKSL